MRFFFFSALLVFGLATSSGQTAASGNPVDSDHDGLADSLEQSLLEQFRPRFKVDANDCSSTPAEFTPLQKEPVVAAENGVIYGQASPVAGREGTVELHYYDLWRKDCGQAGHDLDAEHVSVQVERVESGSWKARYWYAAAHEDTVCDASQIARAKALGAEEHGAEVWVSAGKHGSFLSERACSSGCGADTCERPEPLDGSRVVNLGEVSTPMNGATWILSKRWPLRQKMSRSDFDEASTTRVDGLPRDEIAWANPGKRPVQAAILGGDAALGGTATGLRATDSALTAADANTSGALDTASRKTGNALVRSYRGVKKALKAAVGSKGSATK